MKNKSYAIHIGSRAKEGVVNSVWYGIIECGSVSEARRIARNKCGIAEFVLSVAKKIRKSK